VLHGLGAGALADARQRHLALVVVERRGANLDELVRSQGAVDLGDHGVGETFAAELQDRVERVRAGLERFAFGWCHVLSGCLGVAALVGSGADARHQRKLLWVTDRFDGQIDVEVGPVEMVHDGKHDDSSESFHGYSVRL
jgi:hypothetical protein